MPLGGGLQAAAESSRRASALATGLPPEPVLRTTLDLACRLVAAASDGLLVVLGPDRRCRQVITRAGLVPEGDDPDLGAGAQSVLHRLLAGEASVKLVGPAGPRLGWPGVEGPVPLLGLPLAVDERLLGALIVWGDAADQQFGDDDQATLTQLATQAALTLDHARLVHDARGRKRALEASREASQILLEGRDVDDVLWLVARRARELASASLAIVAAPEPLTGSMVVRVAEGARSEAVLGMALPEEGLICGEVVRSPLPVVLDDTTHAQGQDPLLARVGGVGGAMFVPLAAGSEVFGMLAVVNLDRGATFSEDDLAVVQTFGADAATALRYERLSEDLGRLSVLEERERIAMDLHDGVVQALFAVGLSLQAAERSGDDGAQLPSRLSSAITSIDRTIRDLRHYIFDLRPVDEADRQVESALRSLADTFGRCDGVSLSVKIEPQAASILAPRGAHVVHAAREAVSNAVRHAGTAIIDLRLALEGGDAVLEVIDHGRGFDPAGALGRGSGLSNLRSRAAALGGTCRIDTGPGQGTRVQILVPV